MHELLLQIKRERRHTEATENTRHHLGNSNSQSAHQKYSASLAVKEIQIKQADIQFLQNHVRNKNVSNEVCISMGHVRETRAPVHGWSVQIQDCGRAQKN